MHCRFRQRTGQLGVDGLHRQVAELRPQNLQVVDADHAEVAVVNESDGDCGLVQHAVDAAEVQAAVRVTGNKELVL